MLLDNNDGCHEQCKHTPIGIQIRRNNKIKLIIIIQKDEQIETIRFDGVCVCMNGLIAVTIGCINCYSTTQKYSFKKN